MVAATFQQKWEKLILADLHFEQQNFFQLHATNNFAEEQNQSTLRPNCWNSSILLNSAQARY
jgi:hypothetical protein